MLSIPSPTTEMRVFGEVNSKEKERNSKDSEKYWYIGEKLEVGGDEVITGIENTGDYLASGPREETETNCWESWGELEP